MCELSFMWHKNFVAGSSTFKSFLVAYYVAITAVLVLYSCYLPTFATWNRGGEVNFYYIYLTPHMAVFGFCSV